MNKEKKDILKEECNIDIFLCILYSIIIGIYFISLNFINMLSTAEVYELYNKISYIVFILVAIIIFEVAYKKDNGITAIYGIEFIVLAIHILLIERITVTFNFEEAQYIVITSYIWQIYYCLKAIIIQTKENREKLKESSDIAEIVKQEKPSKKVAKKRKK